MASNAASSGRKRGPGRPFVQGQAANPKGTPRGSRPLPLVALDQRAEAAAAGLIDAMERAALAGDAGAARLLLDRVWPARRGRPLTACPKLPTDPAAAFIVILDAVAAGRLTVEEGQGLAAIARARVEAVDLQELRAEVAALRAERGSDD